jgi:hypothetical protein
MRRYLVGSVGAIVALAAIVTTAQATNGNPINKGSQSTCGMARTPSSMRTTSL